MFPNTCCIFCPHAFAYALLSARKAPAPCARAKAYCSQGQGCHACSGRRITPPGAYNTEHVGAHWPPGSSLEQEVISLISSIRICGPGGWRLCLGAVSSPQGHLNGRKGGPRNLPQPVLAVFVLQEKSALSYVNLNSLVRSWITVSLGKPCAACARFHEAGHWLIQKGRGSGIHSGCRYPCSGCQCQGTYPEGDRNLCKHQGIKFFYSFAW